MNLKHLHVFHLIAKHGHFGLAAKELGIGQSGVSNTMKRFQSDIGLDLIIPGQHPVALTHAGKQLYAITQRIFTEVADAQMLLARLRQPKAQPIRVGSSESFASYYLSLIIAGFFRKYPDCRLRVEVKPVDQLLDQLEKRQLDVCFLSRRPNNPKWSSKMILDDPLILIASPDHPLANKRKIQPHHLADQPIIMHEAGSVPFELTQSFLDQHQLQPPMLMEADNSEAIKGAVASGVGIAFLQASAVQRELEEKQLITLPLKTNTLNRQYYLTWHEDRRTRPEVSQFIQWVVTR